MEVNLDQYLSDTYFYDYKNEAIQNLIQEFNRNDISEKEKATGLYLKIRDGWRYNPYHISFQKEKYRASDIIEKKEGHCIDKSILLIAGLRGLGIPARIHLAKVKNHIGVERLTERFGTNELTPHGMVNIFLNGEWLKASPAFNSALCEKCGVDPLDFNGEEDSVFQEYNRDGNQFMEYLEDYGHFPDLPFDFIMNNMKTNYPALTELVAGKTELRL